MNKNYNLKLDLQFRCNNSVMTFNEFDNNTSDFFMRITNGGKLVDIEKAIVVLAVIKPSGKVASQFVEVKNGLVYADLKPSMKDEIGTYTAQAMLILEDERVVTDVISYEVKEDKIFSLLNDTVETSEEFTLLTDMLSRLSAIEISEEQRMINEAERILSEENRKTEEAERVEAELVRQHEEADRAKYDAIRESNENIRKQNESIRLANETNRIDEEAKRVEEENKRKLAEEERNANYNFMTEDEERRRLEANAHKEAEVLRVQAETNRVNEEAKRRTTEQARVSAENTRVSNENTRKANETIRQTNETQRVEAETQRQNRYNSFIADAEANASNFENYTNTAKVKEEERKSNELDRKSQENRRVSNEVERISNENTRKANEVAREKNETSRQYVFENKVNEVDKKIIEINATKDNFVSSINTKVDNKISELDNAKSDMTTTVSNKVNEVETRFNALTSSQQQDAEVIDARDGEISLKTRLDRDIEKAKQVYVNVEGSHISIDSNVGYAKDVEILGNTIQDGSNLADIRSVGDTVEGQELYEIPVLSCGKNIWNATVKVFNNNLYISTLDYSTKVGISLPKNSSWTLSFEKITGDARVYIWSGNNKVRQVDPNVSNKISFTLNGDEDGISFYAGNFGNYDIVTVDFKIQLEEGTVATPYEPYQEDKLTILSPVQLEKVGDVADRIIEKDGVWGVEKNIETVNVSSSTLSVVSVTDVGNTLRHLFKFNNNVVPALTGKQAVVFNLFKHQSGNDDIEHCRLDGAIPPNFVVWVSKDRIGYSSPTEALDTMEAEGGVLRYSVDQPQFIPLPHDQQIKLRTFANKTNISFLTEIEGTIKAQVPKSIGATVNTHTEQIRSLNHELNRVKKLEESTVSTVTTESDFTTVEATSNGYFEDVKLEGKTLVNIASGVYNISNAGKIYPITTLKTLEPNKDYTLILNVNLSDIAGTIEIRQFKDSAFKFECYLSNGLNVCKINIDDDTTNLAFRTNSGYTGSLVINNMLILEGDHTQNPPSYFEGLKSVGQDVDNIEVLSCNENLAYDERVHTVTALSENKVVLQTNTKRNTYVIENKKYTNLYITSTYGTNVTYVDVKGNMIGNTLTGFSLDRHITNIPSDCKLIYITSRQLNNNVEVDITEDLNVNISLKQLKKYIIPKQDKKQILFYNDETQTWEKPILRQWDSIEKHADGKYYYHQRSGEVVLDGEQGNNWQLEKTNTNTLVLRHPNLKCIKNNENINVICDKFKPVKHSVGWVLDSECIHISVAGELHINISRSNANSLEDALNFLNSANITVVYQLAEEKVYECTNIDLITYANETNYVVESGAIVPRTTLKVHNNISNVVSLLQKKVSLLESKVKASQEVQDMMILETDMRMLDIELALMEFMPMTLDLGGSNMLRSATYFNFLKNHIINETYEKEYLENVMNKYLATGRINQDEYDELYKMLYPPVYDIELPIEY